MLQNLMIVISCFISSFCFSQPDLNNDSSARPISIQHATKDSSLSPAEKTSLKVYPNPAKNKVSLGVTGFDPGIATVKIIDTKGKIWREDNRLLTNGAEEIAMFLMLKAGIYFISVTEKGKTAKKKLIIL
jgi:hypothetical protein